MPPYAQPTGVQFSVPPPNLVPTLAGIQPYRVGAALQFRDLPAWDVPTPRDFSQGILAAGAGIADSIKGYYKDKRQDAKDAEASARWEREQNFREKEAKARLDMAKEEHALKMAKARLDATRAGGPDGFGSVDDAVKYMQGSARAGAAKPDAPKTPAETAADALSKTPGIEGGATPATTEGAGEAPSRDASPSILSLRTAPTMAPPKVLPDLNLAIPQTSEEQIKQLSETPAFESIEAPKFDLSLSGPPGALESPATGVFDGLRATFVKPPEPPVLQPGGAMPSMSPGVMLPPTPISTGGSTAVAPDFRAEAQSLFAGAPVPPPKNLLLGMEAPIVQPAEPFALPPTAPSAAPTAAALVPPPAPGEPNTAAMSANAVKAAQIMAAQGAPAPQAGPQATPQATAPQYREMSISNMPPSFRNRTVADAFAEQIAKDPTNPYRMASPGKPDAHGVYRNPEYVRKDAPMKLDPKLEQLKLRQESVAKSAVVAHEQQVNRNPLVQDFAQKGGPSASIPLLLASYGKASDPNNKNKTLFDNDLLQIVARMARGATPTEAELHLIEKSRPWMARAEAWSKGKLSGDILVQGERDEIAKLAAEVYNEKAQRANEEVARYRTYWAGKRGFDDPSALHPYFTGGTDIGQKMMLKKEAADEMKKFGSELMLIESKLKAAPPAEAQKLLAQKQKIEHEAKILASRIAKNKDRPEVYLPPERPRDQDFAGLIQEFRINPRPKTTEDIEAEKEYAQALRQAAQSGDQGGIFIETPLQ